MKVQEDVLKDLNDIENKIKCRQEEIKKLREEKQNFELLLRRQLEDSIKEKEAMLNYCNDPETERFCIMKNMI